MKTALKILRIAGWLAGAWLVVTFFRDLWFRFSFSTNTTLLAAIGTSLRYFWSTILLGVMLLLPWSRMRPFLLWLPAFVVLVLAGSMFLLRLFQPFTVVWRPYVLLDEGILQTLLGYAVFVAVQFVTIALLRRRTNVNQIAVALR